MTKTFVQIKASGEAVAVEAAPRSGVLRQLQTLCGGGFVEGYAIQGRMFMYCNENFPPKGLAYNSRASTIYGGTIVGDVVITGYPNSQGYETGLTAEQIDTLLTGGE